jgi:hypothetical protein
MNENPSPFLDGANKVEDIVEYSSDFRKVLFGNCKLEIFLKEHPIPDSIEVVEIKECLFSSFSFLHHLTNLKDLIIISPIKALFQ